MSDQLFCDVEGCEDPKNPGFARPAFRQGKCSSHMKQLQRTGKTTKITEKLPTAERLIEAYSAHAEADGDEDFERTKRQFLALAKSFGKESVGEAISAGITRARAQGKRIGRPPKVDTQRVVDLVRLLSSASLAAKVLGVHRDTVYAHLARCREKEGFPTASAPRPRMTG